MRALRMRVLSEYGSRNATTTAPPRANSGHPRTLVSDLLLGLAMVAIPVALVCCVHFCFVCQQRASKTKKHKRQKLHVTLGELVSASTTTTADPLTAPLHDTANADANPEEPQSPPRRPKSKSVTWQSPFETHGRCSRPRNDMAASELHFVMVPTPDKYKTPPRPPRHSIARPPKLDRPSVPEYRLDLLDSPADSEIAIMSTSSSSSAPILKRSLSDEEEIDRQLQFADVRVSVSSLASHDPEIDAKLDAAMRWTQEDVAGGDAFNNSNRLLRCSSSLNDFRHDLHHEQPAKSEDDDENDDPEQITRSSEYSF